MRVKRSYIVLSFRTTLEAMEWEKQCNARQVPGRLIPLPREISAGCGLAWRMLPEDWQSWPLDKRRMFWAGSITGELKLVPRDKVCALEVWCEAFNGSQKEMKYTDTTEINGILETAKGWVRSRNGIRCGYCGLQRGFTRCF